MYIIVLSVAVSILAGIGLITVIDNVMPMLNRPKDGIFTYLIIPLKNNPLDLEQKLRWGYASILWDRWLKGGRLVLLDLGLGEQGREICEAFCNTREDILLLEPSQLEAVLGEDMVCK